MAAVIHSGRPANAGLASRTGGMLLGPIARKVLSLKARPLSGLPVIVKARGPEPIHPIVDPAVDQQGGVQEAGVPNMGRGA
jgi:hypothetical protein